MSTKVSVVIAVWNPGKYIDRCIESLLGQTMPAEDFEVLFMDDGSDDGTETKLDGLAAKHSHFKVHHLPNSGWPGKPRNLGIDAAVGEYILFMDNDDALGLEALERMYAIGARNHSDIVIGKVISNFRGVPHQVFRENREDCNVRTAPLFESLTPHKMFGRQFLLDHDIRYPEGKRRLEDQLIMARAYFPAEHVSIVGDYVCYYYLKRDDGKNAGSTRIEPAGYYNNLREILDVVAANTEPGEFRDTIERRFYRGEMLGRLGGKAVLNYQPKFRDELIDEIRRLALEPRFAPAVHDQLPVFFRVRSYFLRENRRDDLLTYAERTNQVSVKARLEDMGWDGGALKLDVRTWFEFEKRELELVQDGGRTLLPPALGLDAPADQRDCTGQLAEAKVDVTIKNRATSDEFFLPASLLLREVRAESASGVTVLRPQWAGEVVIDPATAFGGRPLPRGVWDVSVRLNVLGISRETRLGRYRAAAADRGCVPAVLGANARIVVPYWTDPYGNLSLDVDEHGKSIRKSFAAGSATTPIRERLTQSVKGAKLTISLPVHVDPPVAGGVELHLVERMSGAVVDLPLKAVAGPAGNSLSVFFPRSGPASTSGPGPGEWDVALTAPAIGWDRPVRYGPVLVVGSRGFMRLRSAAGERVVPARLEPLIPIALSVRTKATKLARRVTDKLG